MVSVMLDDVDQSLVHALHVDGRASFSRIGEVIGISDRTIARRYARMRDNGVIRLAGVVDPGVLGGSQWFVRMQCKPGAAVQVGEALARREDTSWVALLSGGAEISASVQSWSVRERDELILQRLQRTAPVVSVTAHNILHVFTEEWPGYDGPLTGDQVAALRPIFDDAGPASIADADRALITALAVDGRATYPALAGATGWSESTVARRIQTLRAARLLGFEVDLDTEAFGFHAQVRLWASVPPAHLAATGAAVALHPEVNFCAATTGPTNLLISATCRDNADLYRYLTEGIGGLPLISDVQTAPVVRVIKRAGHRVLADRSSTG
jgi:DNA-binding Lrp family transcriptional regulator